MFFFTLPPPHSHLLTQTPREKYSCVFKIYDQHLNCSRKKVFKFWQRNDTNRNACAFIPIVFFPLTYTTKIYRKSKHVQAEYTYRIL